MTAAQQKFYIGRWAAVARHNIWKMANGRMHPEAAREVSAHHEAVWRAAEARALQAHRAVTADDLRHGCHVVALGRDKSSKDFTNREFDQILNLWGDGKNLRGLLIDPLDLGSEIHRANPNLKTRDRILRWLRDECVGSYVVTVAREVFGTDNWEALADADLASLHQIIHARPNARRRQPAVAADNIPF